MFNKIKYIIRCIFKMDFSKLFEAVKEASEICNKNVIVVFFDIVYCGLAYGCGYKDYLLYEFYSLTREQRKTYITRGINNNFVKKLNNASSYRKFDNKNEFLKIFEAYIGRKWLFTQGLNFEEFEKFVAKKKEIIIKPNNGSCGVDVEKITIKEYKSVKDLYDYIMKKSPMIIEEVIEQHEDINDINPYSVNTMRITTIKGNIVYSFIRIGNSKKPIDNINAGGMAAPINIKTGIISGVGYDKNMQTYEEHPITNFKIEGVHIPYWKETIKLVKEISKVIPEVGYVGWDIAITPQGPVLVEGNCHPGHDILQLPAHTPNKTGMLPEFNKHINCLTLA